MTTLPICEQLRDPAQVMMVADHAADVIEALADPAKMLLSTIDEMQSVTRAERIITGRSDADLRKASKDAIEKLRAALRKAEGHSP